MAEVIHRFVDFAEWKGFDHRGNVVALTKVEHGHDVAGTAQGRCRQRLLTGNEGKHMGANR